MRRCALVLGIVVGLAGCNQPSDSAMEVRSNKADSRVESINRSEVEKIEIADGLDSGAEPDNRELVDDATVETDDTPVGSTDELLAPLEVEVRVAEAHSIPDAGPPRHPPVAPRPPNLQPGFSKTPTTTGSSVARNSESDPGALSGNRNGSVDETRAAPNERTVVEVFYATDRKSSGAIVAGDFARIFRWPLIVFCGALLLGIFSLASRRRLIGAVSFVVLLIGVNLGHSSFIEWQRLDRLEKNGDVRYTSDLRNIRDGDEQPLDYGTCLVNIPPDHRVGEVDSPSLRRFEFTEDPDKHVILERVVRGSREDFFEQLNGRLGESARDTFVFVHGYNVSFESAVKRTAQVAFDLKFDGVPICYSWPSHGELEDYTRDMANADWTVVHLQEFLTSLFDETKARKIHVIAHSMGNRALMQALDRLALQWTQEGEQGMSLAGDDSADTALSVGDILRRKELPRFGHIIMAAPDVSADEFRQRYAGTIRKLSDQVTLYASSRDRALMVSTSVHGHNRAGLTGDDICIVNGIDTIDVSHVDTSLIGHSYYGDNPALIDDLRALIQLSRTTSERSWLEQVNVASDKAYWKFR